MADRWEEITESIYRAALEPGAWSDVMSMMKAGFRSQAETFYFLDFAPRKVRPVHLCGIGDGWLARFDELYFTPDNPWCIHSRELHRPGVVRTNERLDAHTRRSGTLYRSVYYNEWMRPQGLRYSIGNTLLAQDGTVANVTLLRAPEEGTFGPDEILAFERLTRHFERALDIAIRLESAALQGERSTRAFDELAHGVVILDPRGRLQYANRAAQARLARGDGLALRDGVLSATLAREQPRLESLLRKVLPDAGPGLDSGPARLSLARGDRPGTLVLSAMRVASGQARYLASRAAILMTIADAAGPAADAFEPLRRLHGFTPAESRLACALAGGESLRDAATRMGVTYSTARGYLKLLFHKTGTHRQAELVAMLMRDLSLPR